MLHRMGDGSTRLYAPAQHQLFISEHLDQGDRVYMAHKFPTQLTNFSISSMTQEKWSASSLAMEVKLAFLMTRMRKFANSFILPDLPLLQLVFFTATYTEYDTPD